MLVFSIKDWGVILSSTVRVPDKVQDPCDGVDHRSV